MTGGAIQVLESIEEKIKNGKNVEELKKIRTVFKYENGPSLEEVLLSEEAKDLPILVFSIAGKTRGGKSFLLNLMIKYLEAQNHHQSNVEWMNGTVSSYFKWKAGIDSITRGLWIFPKIYRLKDRDGHEVGVMLMDNEGMFDGEVTDGEMIAISGISSAISYLQMFNVKGKMTGDYLESVVRNMVKGIEEIDSEDKTYLREDYKLMFIIRDWIGEEETLGLKGGMDYINAESVRGTRENKQLWELIKRTFRNVECVVLPHPGLQVTKAKFTQDAQLNVLDKDFLDVVQEFVETLFSSDRLVTPSNPLTGEDIYNILKSSDGKIADEDLSFLNIFTDHANFIKVEKLKSDFQEQLSHVDSLSDLLQAKSYLQEILGRAGRSLRGKTGPTYLAELRMAIEDDLNKKVTEIVFNQYKTNFCYIVYIAVEKQQSKIWSDIFCNFKKHLCGNNETRQSATITFIKKAAAHYYNLLHKQCKRQFKNTCSGKVTLKDLAGIDEEEIKSFKKCQDFEVTANNMEVNDSLWLKEYQCLKNEFLNELLKKIQNLTEIDVAVLRKLRRKQYEHFELFNLLATDEYSAEEINLLAADEDNSSYETGEFDKKVALYNIIAKKVGYALFGAPSQISAAISQSKTLLGPPIGPVGMTSRLLAYGKMTHPEVNSKGIGYSAEQEKQIHPVVSKIISLNSKNKATKLSIVFVVYNQAGNIVNVPLFRIETVNGIKYLDSNCRQYNEWNDFLDTNTLLDTLYCYPLNGLYNKKHGFAIAFTKSPASEVVRKVLKGTDSVGKCATIVAAGAGSAVLLGATAPVWGAVAVAGGIVGGAYGAFRTVVKMVDKHNHEEEINKKDYFNLVTNVFAVVGAVGAVAGRTAAYAAEGAAILTARVGVALASVNYLTALFMDVDNTTELISLIADAEDNSLKILFYFNTTCSENALKLISKTLNLGRSASSVDSLMALVENNCTRYVTDNHKSEVIIEKYVSQSTITLVTSLLTAVDTNIQENAMLYCNLCDVFQQFANDPQTYVEMAEAVKEIMSRIVSKMQDDILSAKVMLTKSICEWIISPSSNTVFGETLINKLHDGNHNLLFIFMHLVHCIIRTIRQANRFYNSIDHEAVSLKDHYLADVSFHPISEITEKIKEVVGQTEFATNIVDNNTELNEFICHVLNILEENYDEIWADQQFEECLLNISKAIRKCSKIAMEDHKKQVEERKKEKEHLSCNELNVLFKEMGLEGYNYGSWLLKNVLSATEISNGIKNTEKNHKEAGIPTIIPAWGGILDNLYFYYSKKEVDSKFILVRMIPNVAGKSYEKCKPHIPNLDIYKPGDVELLPWYIVYSVLENGGEWGIIWSVTMNSQINE